MKSLPKILKIFFLIIFLFELMGLGLISAVGKTALAADQVNLQLQVPIPGGPNNIDFTGNKSTRPIAEYIRVIYKYAIGIVGILATVMMMVGGMMWILSGGSPERAGEAKAYIAASLTGLVLTLCSYMIVATVNPALVDLKITDVGPVGELGCCDNPKSSALPNVCGTVTQDKCESGWKGINNTCGLSGKCEPYNLNQCERSNGYCIKRTASAGSCRVGYKENSDLNSACPIGNNTLNQDISPLCCTPLNPAVDNCVPRDGSCWANFTRCCSGHCTVPTGNYLRGTCD